jgi:Flp pilus assembly protein TadG
MKSRAVSRRGQRGHLILEFGLVAIMFIPLIIGVFVTGINMVRSIQANHIARDIADMYIHGTDFSDLGMQQIAKRLATGLDLQVGTGTTGNNANNTSNSGQGMVWITKLQWVGDTNSPTCVAAGGAAQCTNTSKFVVLEQIRFGNGTLEATKDTTAGHPTATRDSHGRVTVDVVKTSSAQVPGTNQTALYNLWQGTNPASRTPLQDGQVLYMAEVFFLPTGSFAGRGVYARWFF